MAITNVFEKLGRAVFESPFGANRLAKDAPELAEVRLAVLDTIKARSHRIGGKNVFPYDVVRIELLGIPEEQSASLRSDFLSRYLAGELKTALARSSYRAPQELAVEVVTEPRMPLPGEQWLKVETLVRKAATVEQTVPSNPPVLTVLQGVAEPSELAIEKSRVNIGRTAEVFRASGPSRKNDLAFVGDDEQSRSVSREHAHVRRADTTGEYRLFNDRAYKGDANCGLWIVRDGLSQSVQRGSRGTLLVPGDEIHLGTAVLRFSSR